PALVLQVAPLLRSPLVVPLRAVAALKVAVRRVVVVLQVVLPRAAAVLQVALQPRPPLAVPLQAVAAPQVAVLQLVPPLPLVVPLVARLPS
ncbi:unnamed protein product, partial [Adineta steineri]